jgi:hypothetical protein
MAESTELRVSFGEMAHKPDLTKIDRQDLTTSSEDAVFKWLLPKLVVGVAFGGIVFLSGALTYSKYLKRKHQSQ